MTVNIRKTDFEASAPGRIGRWWALAALVISGLVIGLDTTILITALPTLSSKLGATTTDLQWISAAYTRLRGPPSFDLGKSTMAFTGDRNPKTKPTTHSSSPRVSNIFWTSGFSLFFPHPKGARPKPTE